MNSLNFVMTAKNLIHWSADLITKSLPGSKGVRKGRRKDRVNLSFTPTTWIFQDKKNYVYYRIQSANITTKIHSMQMNQSQLGKVYSVWESLRPLNSMHWPYLPVTNWGGSHQQKCTLSFQSKTGQTILNKGGPHQGVLSSWVPRYHARSSQSEQ